MYLRPSDRTSVRPPDRPSDRVSDRPSARPPDRASAPPSVRPRDRPPDRPSITRAPTGKPCVVDLSNSTMDLHIRSHVRLARSTMDLPCASVIIHLPSVREKTTLWGSQNRPTDRPPDRPSVRPSVRPTVRPPARPSVRPPARPSVRPTVRPYARRSFISWLEVWMCATASDIDDI